MEDSSTQELRLPGFRFHPTEEELISFYLKRAATGIKLSSEVIGFLNIYRHDPCELPGMAKMGGEREWYFFVRRDKREGHGGRPNRTTKNGFWKATGSDRQVRGSTESKKVLGLKKTLVFYTGRAPKGSKTDWVMNEYRLPDHYPSPKEDVVLCKIYRKATSLKILEQRAALEDIANAVGPYLSPPQSLESPEENFRESFAQSEFLVNGLPKAKEEYQEFTAAPSSNVKLGSCKYNSNLMDLGMLDVPKFSMDPYDSFWTPLRSPWIDNWSPGGFANLLNY